MWWWLACGGPDPVVDVWPGVGEGAVCLTYRTPFYRLCPMFPGELTGTFTTQVDESDWELVSDDGVTHEFGFYGYDAPTIDLLGLGRVHFVGHHTCDDDSPDQWFSLSDAESGEVLLASGDGATTIGGYRFEPAPVTTSCAAPISGPECTGSPHAAALLVTEGGETTSILAGPVRVHGASIWGHGKWYDDDGDASACDDGPPYVASTVRWTLIRD